MTLLIGTGCLNRLPEGTACSGRDGSTTGCFSDESCIDGACVDRSGCAIGELRCDSDCRNILRNEAHCGDCGAVCEGRCVGGECRSPVELTVSAQHTCVRMSDGTVWCRQVGGDFPDEPVFEGAASLVAGLGHQCVLSDDGVVSCWGQNRERQAAPGVDRPSIASPTPVTMQEEVVSVSAGAYHTCAATDGGDVLCWGQNAAGQAAPTQQQATIDAPTRVETSAREVFAGWQTTCARPNDGQLECWGRDAPAAGALPDARGYEHVSVGTLWICASDATLDPWCYNMSTARIVPQTPAGFRVELSLDPGPDDPIQFGCGLTAEAFGCLGQGTMLQGPFPMEDPIALGVSNGRVCAASAVDIRCEPDG